MYADEADQDGKKQFLVYAAIFIPSAAALKLHRGVIRIRNDFNFSDEYDLKFSPGRMPPGWTLQKFTEVKSKVIELANECGCKVCCYLVPHDIAKGQAQENRMKFGANTLLSKFDQFLKENGNVPGIVCFDRSNDFKQFDYYQDVFRNGLAFGERRTKLKFVIGLNSTCNAASHLSSVTDIVVGSFRFILNEPDKDRVGAALMKLLAPMCWGVKEAGGNINMTERGFCIRPKKLETEKHKAEIGRLIDRLNALIQKKA